MRILPQLPTNLLQVVNQATVTCTELPAILSDDPSIGGDADPTVAPIQANPLLSAAKTDTLAVDADGVPGLSVEKKGKPVKTLPAALKKDAEVEALKGRLQELKRQRSRVRDALEDAMCRGDRFTSGELRTLLAHPILAPSTRAACTASISASCGRWSRRPAIPITASRVIRRTAR